MSATEIKMDRARYLAMEENGIVATALRGTPDDDELGQLVDGDQKGRRHRVGLARSTTGRSKQPACIVGESIS
jgi:hypothetical protein